jgi:hypothetical protein
MGGSILVLQDWETRLAIRLPGQAESVVRQKTLATAADYAFPAAA